MPRLIYDDDDGRPRTTLHRTGTPANWQRAVPGAAAALGMGVIVVLVFAVGYAILHHERRIPIFRSQADVSGSPTKAKPSPAIPWSAKPQVAPLPTVAPLPGDSVPTSIPAEIVDPAMPGAPSSVVKAKDTEGVYLAKHQKSFGRGCEGKLELTAAGLDFTCTSGSEAPLHFTAAEIKGPNGNGIELKTGEKYHFDLQRSKSEEQQIFMDWAYTHVPGAYSKAGSN